jgi:hypothetical protein
MQDIKNAAVPYNTVGLLDVKWTPLSGPREEDEGRPPRDIDSDEVGTPHAIHHTLLFPICHAMSHPGVSFYDYLFSSLCSLFYALVHLFIYLFILRIIFD